MVPEERRRRDRERQRAYRAADPEGTRARVRAQRAVDPLFWKRYEFDRALRKYKLTGEDWARMFNAQGGRCAICENALDGAKGTHVDHCHESGEVRGLLCTHCNVLLGHARENPAVLAKAAQYLFRAP